MPNPAIISAKMPMAIANTMSIVFIPCLNKKAAIYAALICSP